MMVARPSSGRAAARCGRSHRATALIMACTRPDHVLNEAELGRSTGQRPIALWAVPRSVSTALERSMRARGDLNVFHEPFSAYYYLSRERSNDRFAGGARPDPAHDWRTILEGLLQAGEQGQVFFKDMAYHVSGCMTPELVESFRHAFLIRHPRHTLPSLLKKLPDFTLEEAGFEQQHRLMRVVIEACPDELVVIDGEELRRSPEAVIERFSRKVGLDFRPEALSWKPGFVADWERWRDWHTEVANSTGIKPPRSPRESSSGRLHDGVSEEVYATCLGHFEQMVELARAGTGSWQEEDATPRA